MFYRMSVFVKAAIVVSVMTLGAVPSAWSSPAFPGFVDIALVDGGSIKLAARGDEYFSWYESINGNLYIAQGGEIFFATFDEHGAVVASDFTLNDRPPAAFVILNIQQPEVIAAVQNQSRIAREAVQLPSAFLAPPSHAESILPPASSTPLLTIQISFTDQQIIGSREYWQDLIYQKTSGFYGEVSRGEFSYVPAQESEGVSNDGIVHVSLNQLHPNPVRTVNTAVQFAAIAEADAYIDFAQYDLNGDGVLANDELNILFVYAGWESAASGELYGPSVWAHVSYMSSGSQTYDGLYFQLDYARIGEQQRTNLATMGVIAHELGHLTFHWPDLYDTTSSSTDGNNELGRWCLMSSGSWGAVNGEPGGATPAIPNPILRHWAGWEPARMTAGTHELMPTLDGGQALKIETNDTYHYAFVEAKSGEGYDGSLGLGQSGLLVWKYRGNGSNAQASDFSGATIYPYITLTSNIANQDGIPGYTIYPAQALWPADSGANAIGTTTNPSLHVSDGRDRNVVHTQSWDLSNIVRLGDGVMRFNSTKTSNTPPIMTLTAPASAYQGDTVTFDASASRDQDGVIAEYRWQGPWGTQSTSVPSFQYAFSALGVQQVTLTAIDNEGASNSTTLDIDIVDPATPPVAVISGYTSTTINLADSINFLAFDSYDPKPDGAIVSYRWIGPWGNQQGAPYFSHRFFEAGEFTVTLEVTDRNGATDQDSVVITVLDDGVNLPPVAVVPVEEVTIILGNAYRFTSSASYDEDGSIVATEWQGPWGSNNYGTFYWVFYDLGEFTITLTVTDNEGASSSDTMRVRVVERQYLRNFDNVYLRGTANNWQATAMTLIGDNSWQTVATFGGAANERFKLDIYGDWTYNLGDSNGDGVMERTGGDIFITQGAGNYRIEFNDQSLAYSVTKVVEPLPPVANAGADITVEVGETVQFNGSASSDPDGSIVSYVWSNGLSGVNPTLVYDTVGSYTVTLTVTDNSGLTDTDELVVTVTDIDTSYQSVYPQAYFRGTANNWAAGSMTLVADYTWEYIATFSGAANDRFKFDINGNWTLNFGDNNADGTLEQSGGDIYIAEGAGSYVIRFNDQNHSYTVQKQVGPQAPVANAGADMTVNVGDTVQFNGSQSSDADGSIVSYSWSNGVSGVNPTFVYNTAGVYTVTLTVTDNDGLQGTDTVVITVEDGDSTYDSNYSQVYLRGTANNWSTTAMALIADYTWEVTATFGSATNERFKFDIYGNWTLNFGDNNGDGFADQTGNDITITQGAGSYRIRFNDQTRAYSVSKL